jgi:UDP-N-acetyl-D-galactosamine dehydrogenase
VKHEYGLHTISSPQKKYDAVVLAVGHKEFRDLDWKKIKHDKTVVYDVKGFLDQSIVTARL